MIAILMLSNHMYPDTYEVTHHKGERFDAPEHPQCLPPTYVDWNATLEAYRDTCQRLNHEVATKQITSDQQQAMCLFDELELYTFIERKDVAFKPCKTID